MQQKQYSIPGFDLPVFVHHEEDWSGMAVIEWWDGKLRRVEIPARLILALSFAETKQWVLGQIEHTLNTEFNRDPNKGRSDT